MLCSEWTLVKHSSRGLFAEPLKCKCWACELCGPMRTKQLVRQAFLGRPDTFLTLTVNPSQGANPHARAQALSRAWRLLRLRAMRHYGLTALPFLAVFERTKAGEPHLHILLRVKWLDQKWLSDQMKDLIDAPIVDVRRVTGTEKVAAYVAKYVAKDPTRFYGCKRYWSSRDYEMPDIREEEVEPWEDPTFKVVKMPLSEYLGSKKLDGFLVTQEADGAYSLRYDWDASQDLARGRPRHL